jgi:hypothetical protein
MSSYHAYYDTALGKMVEGRPPKRERVNCGWPLECYASGVHASQRQELVDFFEKHGEHVEVTKSGNPIYTSARQRKRLLALRGFFDRSAFC